jgi:hypothetical protein
MHASKPVALILALSITGAAHAGPADFDAMLHAKCPAAARRVDAMEARQKALDAAPHAAPTDPALRSELLSRSHQDEDARNAAIAASASDVPALFRKVQEVDRLNLAWLRPHVEAAGFPTKAAVGRDGLAAAFILVQHADTDPAFQARVLASLGDPVRRGIPGEQFALLTDRVLRSQGKPQRYGTQMLATDPAHPQLQPTEDESRLDSRRAALGMLPMADYRCMMAVVYAPAPHS